jgi:hypothetical protein
MMEEKMRQGNNMQALIDGLSAQWQRERAASQMTLGEMIETLEKMPKETKIEGLGELQSYRGYYADLSFEPETVEKTASELLAECRAAMGQVFEGYKGGDFVMGALTPLWHAEYGCTGKKIVGISEDGIIETAEDE